MTITEEAVRRPPNAPGPTRPDPTTPGNLAVADVARLLDAPYPALPFIQFAFSGHARPGDLGDVDAIATALENAFVTLAAAGVRQGRLLTGLAPGADGLAAKAWTEAGLGPIHVVYPFLADPFLADRGDGVPPAVDAATWLNGEATRAYGRNPHLAQARWLIGAADLLVVVWTGRHGRGAGGAADAVRLALEHGLPVLWVDTANPHRPRLIRPEYLDEDFGFLEFLEELRYRRAPLVQDATAETLHIALSELGLDEPASPPDEAPPAGDGKAKARGRHVAWPWRTYAVFRRLLGGKTNAFTARPPPEDLQAQLGFESLTRARDAADEQANRLGSIHRSHQVILLGVAILAATAGSASGLWPHLKVATAAIELVLALGALMVWLGSERGERHRLWGEARKLAEDLRIERAAWAVGVSTVAAGQSSHGTGRAARRERRLAGLPQGAFDPKRVAAWGEWAVEELITGQVAYHRAQSTINGRISHRVHQVENLSFGILMLVLLSYVAAAVALSTVGRETPHWLSGMVVLTGAIVPAIGAAGLALEATLALGEQSRRSRVLSAQLESLMANFRPSQGLERLQAVARTAIRLQCVQEDHWTEDTSRRRLLRVG
jgi:hypothetical protein